MYRSAAALLVILTVAAGLGGPARAQSDGLVDEATREPALVEARRQLIEALERRSEAALRPLLHPKIAVGNGGEGPDDLVELLRERPSFAVDYVAILRLGGRFAAPDLFLAPYTAKPSYPEADESRLFARKAGAMLRTAPRADAPLARALGHAVVEAKFDEALAKEGWIQVVGPSGYSGYVRVDDVYFVGQIFIHIRKLGDRWLVVRAY
jgi:hypothetical protein